MARAMLRLFGPPRLEGLGDPIVFRAERRFQLLAYLAMRGDWVPRDELAHLFWPDPNNASARQNLRWVLYSLRDIGSAGGLGGLSAERERVRFVADTDVVAFERALAEQRPGDAVALYVGPFVDGLEGGASEPFGRWAEASRSRFADAFRGAALALAQLPSADTERRIAIGRRLLDHDPYDEEALALIVRGLCAGGRMLQAQRLYQQFAERLLIEMGLEPSAETRRLASVWSQARQARAEGAAQVAAAIPAPASFVGRRDELAQIDALLAQPECRLLTIIGPGGIGKSRLAAEVLALHGGGEIVSLEGLSVPSQIAPQVARKLGLSLPSDSQAEAAVQAHFGERAVLIVLDNFEHVIDGAGLLVRWLGHCPRLQLIVTSRERLDAAGEWLFPLEGLAGPRQGSEQARESDSDAVRLFALHAGRSCADFDVERELDGICDIVALVEGMPLAIELAAVWTRLLPCADIAADLRSGLDVLTAAGPLHRAEHASMRASFEHSWGLLLPRERELLGRLGVFRGGFTHAAARQVADAALPALAALVDKSLLRSTANGRFSLHPLLHQFASEKFAAGADPKIDVQARHGEFFLALTGRPENSAATPANLRSGIDADLENCLAAWHWAVAESRFDLLESSCRSLAGYLANRGRMRDGLDLFAAAAGHLRMVPAPQRLRAHVERSRANFLMRVGALAEAEACGQDALRSYRVARDGAGILSCMILLGNTSWQRGDYERAKTYFREGLKRARVEGDAAAEWKFAMNLAVASQAAGDYPGARELFELAASNARRRADRSDLSVTLNNLGNLCVALEDDASARTHLLESLALAEATGNRMSQPFTLVNLAIIDIGSHEPERARGYVERALEIVRTGADRQVEPMCLYTLARVELECGDFERAHHWLAEAARISLATQNVPNMVEVAIWAAQLAGREGALEPAVEALSVVLEHPRTSAHERQMASEQLATIAAQLPAAALDRASQDARALTLEAVMQRVIAAPFALPR